ncbi:hypothetical protein C3486_25000 [Streptomyces sp. Ru73]|nr:hypothetical protein C3486_25000 [Streptomyces sp. Ru73]
MRVSRQWWPTPRRWPVAPETAGILSLVAAVARDLAVPAVLLSFLVAGAASLVVTVLPAVRARAGSRPGGRAGRCARTARR